MNPVFIVEGQTEQRFIQKICPGKKVVTLGCNGDKVKSAVIAKKLKFYYNILNNRHHPIIVLLDRERRQESIVALKAGILAALDAIGVDQSQFKIGVADRKVEAWMLYAVTKQGQIDGDCTDAKEDEFEGVGDSELIRRLALVDIPYHKTTDGVEILFLTNAAKLSKKSSSFREFRKEITFKCDWLKN